MTTTPELVAKTYHAVLTALVRVGRAPESATLADQLGIPPEEARAALADLAGWLFPGRELQIDSACLDCNDRVRVKMRDGVLLEVTPVTAVSHHNLPFSKWREDLKHT